MIMRFLFLLSAIKMNSSHFTEFYYIFQWKTLQTSCEIFTFCKNYVSSMVIVLNLTR